MRVALYARVSTDAQEARGTIGSQLEVLHSAVANDGHQVVGEFVDDGYSGARLDRPGLDALRDAAETGAIDAVWCLSPDRLARVYAYQVVILDELSRHQAQRWLAPRSGADVASTSGEHLGRLAGFKNWKRGGTWVNVVEASHRRRRWVPRAGDAAPLLGVEPAPESTGDQTSCSTDTSPSGVEWGWVCGMLEAGLPPRETYYRLVERARSRRGRDAERYARYTVGKALARARPTALRM